MCTRVDTAYQADAVFIGGGPVGLFTAAQMKALNPDAKVTVVERYNEYKRKHVLIIDSSSLKGMANHPELKKFAEMIKQTNTIATSKIESSLKKIAEDLGVHVIHERVKEPGKLHKKFKNAKVIFGTDGAHSTVRKKIFGNKESERQTVSHIAEVKYLVNGHGHNTKQVLKSSMKHYSHRWVTEHVGKRNAQGKTPITIRLALTKREFESLRSSGKATFKDPLRLDTEAEEIIPSSLQRTIKKWLDTKKKLYNESPEDIKITATNLDVYRSEEFVTKKQDVTYALIGDSAFGVPFFRSLNNGLLCATKAAKEFAPHLHTSEKPDLSEASSRYKTYVTSLAKTQIQRAKIKGFVLSVYFRAIRIVSQITFLPFKEKLIDFFVFTICFARSFIDRSASLLTLRSSS
ncbi:MAG: hypothetical protein S4CHLAM37_13780 [Chlamydiia bacterium]|nr:hypothetical protein [Chlamydiia bacterium]